MKKIAIPYAVTTFALGVTLIALGIYLCSFDLAGSLADSLEGSGSAGLVLYLVLYIPILLVQFCLFGFIILGIPYLIWAGFALARILQYDLDSLKRNSFAVTVYNALILSIVLSFDFIMVLVLFREEISLSAPFIIFTVLISVLCVALEVLSVLTDRKAKKIIIERWHSR